MSHAQGAPLTGWGVRQGRLEVGLRAPEVVLAALQARPLGLALLQVNVALVQVGLLLQEPAGAHPGEEKPAGMGGGVGSEGSASEVPHTTLHFHHPQALPSPLPQGPAKKKRKKRKKKKKRKIAGRHG